MRPRDLSEAVATGALLKPRQGIYCLPEVNEAVLEALRHGGHVACVTAARRHGLWVLDPPDPPDQVDPFDHVAEEPVHVWIDPAHNRRAKLDCACVRHRETSVGDRGLWIVSVVQCLIELAWCQGDEAFFAALESARRLGKVRAGGLTTLRSRVPMTMRWLADFSRSDAGSGLESLLRLRLHRWGLSLTTQVRIPGVGVVDFVIGDCLILEADGKENHAGMKRHKDLRRDALAMRLGFVTLRFDYALIVYEWDTVEDAIVAALARELHRSPAGLRRELESRASRD